MKIFVFGSSLTSTYWNGAATYYRGIYKYLHRRGHSIIFAEPGRIIGTSLSLIMPMFGSIALPMTFLHC